MSTLRTYHMNINSKIYYVYTQVTSTVVMSTVSLGRDTSTYRLSS